MRVRALLAVAALCVATLGGSVRAEPSIQTATTTPAGLDYLQYCSGCHQSDGSGSAGNHVPRLPDSVGHFTRSAAGRAFLIQVGGVAQSPLSDEAVAALLNWLLPTFDQANIASEFTPYRASEVTVARNSRPADLMAARKQLAKELALQGHVVSNY